MIYSAILTASLLLLLAFGIEHFSKRWGLPSVVLLLAVGIAGKLALKTLGVELVNLDTTVQVFGTIGLILIVLEGAFDIELKPGRGQRIQHALVVALAGLLVCGAVFSALLVWGLSLPLYQAVLIALALAVISSSVAIPSSQSLPAQDREFVLYESSLSDILGILLFFTVLHSDGTAWGFFVSLLGGSLLSLLFGAACAMGLLLMLLRVGGHIRFVPMLAALFALYAGGQLIALSPLLMVLLFGLVINNVGLLSRVRGLATLADETHAATVREFKSITAELTFAVRGFFFILLGYWTDLAQLEHPNAWVAAALVLATIYGGRRLIMARVPGGYSHALVWLAPRGLITVLLYLQAKKSVELPAYMDGAVLLVVLFSALAITLSRSARQASRVVAEDA